MSDFRDRFGTQLHGAAQRLAAQERVPARAPRRPRRRRAGLVAGLAAAALGAAFVVGLSSPPAPDGGGSSARSTTAADAPPREQLERLGVLRRPATAADRSAKVRAIVSQLSGEPRTAFVRRLDRGGDAPVVLLPMRADAAPEFMDDAPGGPPRDALCLYVTDPVDGGGVACQDFDGVRRGRLAGGMGTRIYGLVPDGVAAVVVHRLDGTEQRVPVAGNFYDFDEGKRVRLTVDWLDADGRPVPKR